MGTMLVGAALLIFVGLAVNSIRNRKKNGKSIQCGGDCSQCGRHCH